MNIFFTILHWTIIHPLRLLYLHGPSFGGIGFWEGKSPLDICSQISQLDAQWWGEHEPICEQLIEKKFTSFAITISIFFYFLSLLYLLFYGICYCSWKKILQRNK